MEVLSSYPPAPEFAANANATAAMYDEAEADRLAFWAGQANRLTWETPFTEVLDWSQAPVAKWFVGGKLNVAYNCVDRHVEAGNGDRVAIYWEGEPVGDAREITYAQLKDEVCQAANTLAELLGGFDTAVAKMNAKAVAIGATNTHATTPSGLDGPGGSGWTTPHDLAAIFRAAMANPVFAEITAQPAAMFPTDTGERPLVNQDELLVRYPGAIGGKTGYTDAARKTFVGAADRGGRRLVIAMMYGLVREGGPTYWDQAAMLLDWGFAQNPSESVATL